MIQPQALLITFIFAIVFVQPSTSELIHNGINYRVDLKDGIAESGHNYKTMKLQNGTTYRCRVEEGPAGQKRSEPTDAELQSAGVSVITKNLNKRCVVHAEGWWTYEYCHGKHVVQYHMDTKGKVFPKYSLGTGPSNLSLHRDGEGVYFSSTSTEGDVCDITGLPRSTVVQYRCPTSGASTTSQELQLTLKEVRTCSYLVTVSIRELCPITHPNSEKDLSIIPCHQVAL
eukprot:TRINITY_DN18130_c0_g1_i1.p1 TRINITY_DN18130_c0_g1~~TRINITY_DN18130_c0_g1_i1.p1  ORF type:complete len:229 (+),score=24.10 TRINITY_DN18130_c0_g1_i1:62-748(+)